jgi:arylsulfatase A-like enzyme
MRFLAFLAVLVSASTAFAERPNILIVITDDQGFGDLGVHGNPILQTPKLDAFAKQSVWLKNFTVCPVCSPTRSALLTGLYNYRTGVVDTFIGRSLMRPDVPTLPDQLAKAGYRTGLFGKWHLGDNYPLRPEDRGFQETLWSRGGGLAQPSDHPDADPKTAYFDPRLVKNGKEIVAKGYCTDAFTDGAVEFISKGAKEPFLAYVAYNAPHGPYQVPEEAAIPYRRQKLGADAFPKLGQPWAGAKVNERDIADAYGMIENIDTNFGRLLKALDDRKIADNTIVIFLTDNGPGGVRFNAGLRNRKGTVYEGGIRVPCYVRWPKELKAGHIVELPTAHIDLAPTLLGIAGEKPRAPLDGRDLLPLLRNGPISWLGRTIFTQWHRGDKPEKFRAFSARGPKYKLVQAAGVQPGDKWQPKYELFDLDNDPFEQTDLAAKEPGKVEQMKQEYVRWFEDVTKLGFEPARIHIGSEKESLTRLSRQDWRGPKAGWTPDSIGNWEVYSEQEAKYEITFRSKTPFESASLSAGDKITEIVGTTAATTKQLTLVLPKGNVTLKPTVERAGKVWGPEYLEVKLAGTK